MTKSVFTILTAFCLFVSSHLSAQELRMETYDNEMYRANDEPFVEYDGLYIKLANCGYKCDEYLLSIKDTLSSAPEVSVNGSDGCDVFAGAEDYITSDCSVLIDFPQVLSEIENIEGIDLSFNAITRLPDTLALPNSTTRLFLAFNPLCEISAGPLKHIKILDLSFTAITKLPEDFIANNKLEWLRLTGTPMTEEYKEELKRRLSNCRIEF